MIIDEANIPEFEQPDEATAAEPYPSVFSRFRAGREKATVAGDLMAYNAQVEADVLEEVATRLPAEVRDEISQNRRVGRDPNLRQELILEAAAQYRTNDDAWIGIPTSSEAFTEEVNRRRLKVYEEAEAVLSSHGAGIAGVAGEMAAYVIEPTNLALTTASLPFGGWGGAAATGARMSLGRVMLMEAALNATAEGLALPDQYRVSEELGLPEPKPVQQVAMGAAFGAALPAGVAGINAGAKRFAEYYFGKQLVDRARLGPDGDPMGSEIAQSEARAELEGETRPPFKPGQAPKTYDVPTPENWEAIRAGIFDGESGGDYDALFGFSNRPGGPFSDVRLTEMTVDEAIEFSSGGSPYAEWVRGKIGYMATPMGAYQIVGSTLRGVKRGMGLSGDEVMTPELQDAMGKYILATQGTDAWEGYRGPRDPAKYAGAGAPRASDLRMIGGVRPDGRFWQELDGLGAAHAGNPDYRDYSQLFREYTFEAKQGYVPVGERGGRTVYAAPDYMRDADGNYISVSAADAARMAQENGSLIPTRDEYKALVERAKRVTMPTQRIAQSGGSGDSAAYTRAVAEEMVDIAPGTPVVHGKEFFLGAQRRSNVRADAQGGEYTGYTTSRGYTQTGQVVVGDDMRLDVEYQVVDLDTLRPASGDLQPRDRTRAASDDWVTATAAGLDPALLMPAPTADRGAPLVGPDDVIESGNGRTLAIQRAYEQGLDRALNYRRQIEAAGYTIPEGVERPVLIARRQTELDAETRRRMVVDAQDSGVARLTTSERANIGRAALTPDVLDKYEPSKKLTDPANRDFARAFMNFYPKAERGAFTTRDKGLSIDGVRQIQDSLFARAWSAPDIIARAVEEQPGELKSLMDALQAAAPDMALLRAEIDAGLIRPEMDISPFVLEAVRLITTAREMAAAGQGRAAEILEELLADEDMFAGVWSPLTQALVTKFMPKGRAARAQDIAGFLSRYAQEARAAGKGGDMFDAPGPLEVLKAIDKKTFGDLEAIGHVREPLPEAQEPEMELAPEAIPADAYEDGARSPEAEAADQLLEDELRGTPDETDPDADVRAELEAAGEELDLITFEQPDGTTITAREMLDAIDNDRALEDAINTCLLGGANG